MDRQANEQAGVDVQETARLRESGEAVVLDVREQEEWQGRSHPRRDVHPHRRGRPTAPGAAHRPTCDRGLSQQASAPAGRPRICAPRAARPTTSGAAPSRGPRARKGYGRS